MALLTNDVCSNKMAAGIAGAGIGVGVLYLVNRLHPGSRMLRFVGGAAFAAGCLTLVCNHYKKPDYQQIKENFKKISSVDFKNKIYSKEAASYTGIVTISIGVGYVFSRFYPGPRVLGFVGGAVFTAGCLRLAYSHYNTPPNIDQ